MKKVVYYALLIVLIGVFAFSAYKIGSYYLEKYRSDKLIDHAAQHVHVDEDKPKLIEVDFDALREINSDIVAWLYCPDTQINYPVVKGTDNDFYLTHALDRSWNDNGSIFMDYRGVADFSDPNNILYGHHMKTGAMFAVLIKYKEQSFYDAHPTMYLLTPQQNYQLNLFSGTIVPSNDEIYSSHVSLEHIKECTDNSTFAAKTDIPTDHPVLTLSTCSYEFKNARYVVLAEIVPMT